ncbi:MAG: chorismate mutase [Eubacterium sp.]|nr:chorismate mutase [Eubacterium sp.]
MTLEEARQDIDKIDNELKTLFFERMKVSAKIAAIKKETGDEIYKPDREKIVIERLSQGVDEDLREEYQAFVRSIMEISRNYQFKKISEKN